MDIQGIYMRKAFCTLLSGLLLTHQSTAQEINEDYFFEDLPIVLSASRLKQPLIEASSEVTVIDHEMIKYSGATDIAELFRLVPGFVVAYEDGNSPVASLHGLGNLYVKNIQVLINGRSVYSPVTGGIFWSNLPFGVSDIERIEVIRGPNAALYGSNSFNAVINITTKHAAASMQSSASSKVGTNNFSESKLNHVVLGEDWDFSLSLSHKNDEGFDELNDAQNTNKLYTSLNIKPSADKTITTEMGYIDGHIEEGNNNSLEIERDTDIKNYFGKIKFEQNNTSGDTFTAQYSYDKNTSDDIFSANISLGTLLEGTNPAAAAFFTPEQLELNAAVVEDIDFSYFSIRQELELTYQPNNINTPYRYIIGASLNESDVLIKQLFGRDDPVTVRQRRLFYNGEYKTNKAIFSFGAMAEKDNIAEDIDYMPKFSSSYLFDDENAIRYTYSEASIAPLALEKLSDYRLEITPIATGNILIDSLIGTEAVSFTNWASSGNLERETVRSNELAYKRHSKKDRLVFTASYFDNKNKKIISNTRGRPVDFINDANLDLKGYELSIDKQFDNARITGGYTNLQAKDNTVDGNYENSVPDKVFFIFANYRHKKHAYSSTLNYYENVRMQDSGLLNTYTFLNLNYQYQTKVYNKDTSFSFTAKNLANNDYEYRRTNIPEKLYQASVEVKF